LRDILSARVDSQGLSVGIVGVAEILDALQQATSSAAVAPPAREVTPQRAGDVWQLTSTP
jgi:hypothetical protein